MYKPAYQSQNMELKLQTCMAFILLTNIDISKDIGKIIL